MFLKFLAAIVALIAIAFPPSMGVSYAKEYFVTPTTDLKKLCEDVVAGDSIVLQNGTWKNEQLAFAKLAGTKDLPVSIVAQTSGKVVFTGRTKFQISGSHVIVSGFVFRDCHSVKNVFETRTKSNQLAQHCRVTDCAFERTSDVLEEKENTWLAVYGSDHRIDHCYFAGKQSKGTTLVVWVAEQPERHRIDHNFFGPRPKLGENGGETIRIGASKESEFICASVVEENCFFQCNGEAEIISNKSCENIYRHNLFDECSGALTLRHGHRCLVEGNVFLGRGKPGTGGVRIIGERHRVINNYFEGLRGDKERAAISFMNGIPAGPLNGYAPVRNAIVAHNTLIDCKVTMEIGVGAGKKQSVAPADSVFANNVFDSGKWGLMRLRVQPVGFRWQGNKQQAGGDIEDQPVKFDLVKLNMSQAGFLKRPVDTKSLLAEAMPTIEVATDIDGQSRGKVVVAGCDLPGKPLRKFPSATDTGPSWWQTKDPR